MTIAWTAIAGIAGLVTGALARSVSLTAFGLDCVVEMTCAVVLLSRLSHELEHGRDASEASERRAASIVGILLLAAASYIAIDALVHLARHLGAQTSAVGIAFTLATIPIMVPLARAKFRIAREIASRALHADAVGNAVVWYLAAVVLASLVGQRLFHLWWLDGAASLAVVVMLLVEGVQAVRGADIATAD